MGLFSKRSDRELAETKYAGRQSASDRAAQQRRRSHRRHGAQDAADAGERWEQQDRANTRTGAKWWRS